MEIMTRWRMPTRRAGRARGQKRLLKDKWHSRKGKRRRVGGGRLMGMVGRGNRAAQGRPVVGKTQLKSGAGWGEVIIMMICAAVDVG